MGSYKPLHITGYQTGLVQSREEFLLPNDAYPILENAFVWRERIKRKQGSRLLGRLRRTLADLSLGATIGAQTTYIFPDIFAAFIPPVGAGETNKEIEPGSLVITIGAPDNATFTDNGDGTFSVTGVGVALGSSINYITGAVTIVLTASGGGGAITASINYFPGLPVMGLRSEELNDVNNERLVAFDTKYAYRYSNGWLDFLSPNVATWTGGDTDFFWSTNYWVGVSNQKIFWVTNNVDPIRYTTGDFATAWQDFQPPIQNGDPAQLLVRALMILPFRSRMVALNTFEGPIGSPVQYRQRIRWAEIGNPFYANNAIITSSVPEAWFDDVRGKGGFLDIPTAENIVSCGYVRDNLVIYCERSTWQLRYTGRSIAPFQIERVNSELGTESTFSAIQFDTSLVGVGDKGIVECDSYKSERIDIKIPDLVFEITNNLDAPKRVHGIRDFQQKLAYWCYPYSPAEGPGNPTYPNRRLVYNYENDSWAIFIDSFTCFGTFQNQSGKRWQDFTQIPVDTWEECDFPWITQPSLFPSLVAGNQQGFVVYLGNNLSGSASNGISLTINGITGFNTTATLVNSKNHNLETGTIIEILNIPTGTPFDNLNGVFFMVDVQDIDSFNIYKFDAVTNQFDDPQLDPSTNVYIGGGKIEIRDNFSIVSKKFNYLDEGQNIQIGYIDLLMNATDDGEITLNMYLDYNDSDAINHYPEKSDSDEFFNTVIPTSVVRPVGSTKNWQRVFCAARGAFITLEYTLSAAQMNGSPQESDVQIDSQIIWTRMAGKQLPASN